MSLRYLRALENITNFYTLGFVLDFICLKISPLIFQNMAFTLQGYDL